MQAITQYLKSRGFGCVDESYRTYIRLWAQWYRGKVPAFHSYRQYNGRKKIRRERKSLGMAKMVAEDWASLAMNEKAEIVVGKKTADRRVQAVLEANHFRARGNQLVELAFALGTGAFVEYLDAGEVKLDYIPAGMIYPLSWDNGEVAECAFASERVKGNDKLVYLNIHRLEGGKYIIENSMFRRSGNCLTPVGLPEGTSAVVRTGSGTPHFQIVRPNLANNLDPDCPMGLSIYANALDQLEGLDLVYDSYCNEFRLGKKRITVPVTMAQTIMEEDGSTTPVFDDNDTEFYALTVTDPNGADNKLVEHNMELRYEAHEAGVKTALGLLSYKCGLGTDRYSFEPGGVKTATEVVSEKSDLFQNLKKHELVLRQALTGMALSITDLLGLGTGYEVSVNFDDSIIEDVPAEKAQFLQEIRDGVRQKWEYRVKFLGETPEAAKAMAPEARSDEELMGFGGKAPPGEG